MAPKLLTADQAQARHMKNSQARVREQIEPMLAERIAIDEKRNTISETVVAMNRERRDQSVNVTKAELPDDWRDQHWKTRIKLAERLAGQKFDNTPSADAWLEGAE